MKRYRATPSLLAISLLSAQMSVISAFSEMVKVAVTKNENISVTHFANQQFMDLLRRAARGIVRDEKLELYEKYALADAVATLAIVDLSSSTSPPGTGFTIAGSRTHARPSRGPRTTVAVAQSLVNSPDVFTRFFAHIARWAT